MVYVLYISLYISFVILLTLWTFTSTQYTYQLITFKILFYRLLLLNNIVDTVILYKTAPMSSSYFFTVQSYNAQTPHGNGIFSVRIQVLLLVHHRITPPLPNTLGKDINPLSNKIINTLLFCTGPNIKMYLHKNFNKYFFNSMKKLIFLNIHFWIPHLKTAFVRHK